MKPPPARSTADRPRSSTLNQPQALTAAEAQEVTQQWQVTAKPPGGRHLPGFLRESSQHRSGGGLKDGPGPRPVRVGSAHNARSAPKDLRTCPSSTASNPRGHAHLLARAAVPSPNERNLLRPRLWLLLRPGCPLCGLTGFLQAAYAWKERGRIAERSQNYVWLSSSRRLLLAALRHAGKDSGLRHAGGVTARGGASARRSERLTPCHVCASPRSLPILVRAAPPELYQYGGDSTVLSSCPCLLYLTLRSGRYGNGSLNTERRPM